MYAITGTFHKFKFSDRKYSYYIKSLNSIFILWHKRSPFCKNTKFFGKESSPKSVSLNICRKYNKLKDCNNLWNALHCLICYMFRFIKNFVFILRFLKVTSLTLRKQLNCQYFSYWLINNCMWSSIWIGTSKYCVNHMIWNIQKHYEILFDVNWCRHWKELQIFLGEDGQ